MRTSDILRQFPDVPRSGAHLLLWGLFIGFNFLAGMDFNRSCGSLTFNTQQWRPLALILGVS